jgi:hypothetical protein
MAAMSPQMALDFTGKWSPAMQAATAAGMQQADEHADPEWRHLFDACLVAVARRMAEFTSDDVLNEMDRLARRPQTHNLSAIGPAMKRARALGVMEATDRVRRSQRPEKHGNRQNVWRSRYVGMEAARG